MTLLLVSPSSDFRYSQIWSWNIFRSFGCLFHWSCNDSVPVLFFVSDVLNSLFVDFMLPSWSKLCVMESLSMYLVRRTYSEKFTDSDMTDNKSDFVAWESWQDWFMCFVIKTLDTLFRIYFSALLQWDSFEHFASRRPQSEMNSCSWKKEIEKNRKEIFFWMWWCVWWWWWWWVEWYFDRGGDIISLWFSFCFFLIISLADPSIQLSLLE